KRWRSSTGTTGTGCNTSCRANYAPSGSTSRGWTPTSRRMPWPPASSSDCRTSPGWKTWPGLFRRVDPAWTRSSRGRKASREEEMKQYLLRVYQPDGDLPPPEVLELIMRDVEAVDQEMKAAGVWVFAGGLHDPGTATVLRATEGGDVLVTDGPY